MAQVIVVGGGLSGLSACHTILERGGRVLLLDKNSFLGGNSTKATSGINGALTNTQIKLGIPDSAQTFYDDTAHSARAEIRPELVKVLTYQSSSAVEWLQDKFQLDLSLVSRLGGHSHPRTHRGKERFPGMTITYALMEKLEDLALSNPDRVRIIKKAKVNELLKDGENVIGVEYELLTDGSKAKEFGPVVLATGGYAADFTNDSLLRKYRPEIYDLPSTNGDWATGDGIKMTLAAGGNAVTLDKVQVHPTGLVDPAEPDAKWKFLAAEALRGVGGLLLDARGQRFCDELGHRDYVTGEMWKNKGPFRLVLNSAAGREIEWHVKHYTGRGLMKHFKSGQDLAREMGLSPNILKASFDKYNEIAQAKKDPFGKKFFQNARFTLDDSYWVAVVCPVLHFTMGGVEIDHEARVKSAGDGKVMPGLYAAGEVAGGVHGANRLGGSSLLGCVVYGRVAGASATQYLLENLTTDNDVARRRLAGVVGHLAGGGGGGDVKVGVRVSGGGVGTKVSFDLEWPAGGATTTSGGVTTTPTTASKTTPAPPPPAAAPKPLREITLAEVAKHNTEQDCWVVVNGEVLDATKFLPEHPGGKKAIILYAGRDATEEFNMLHKPDVVAKYAPDTVIGKLKK